jgi:hypothetical protein
VSQTKKLYGVAMLTGVVSYFLTVMLSVFKLSDFVFIDIMLSVIMLSVTFLMSLVSWRPQDPRL